MATQIRPHPNVVQNTALTPSIRRETILYIECHTSTTPAVGPRRPLLVLSFAHNITSEWGGMLIVSTVSAKHSVAAWKRCNWMVSYSPPDSVPSTKSGINGSFVASPRISIPRMAWQFKSTTTVSMFIDNPCTIEPAANRSYRTRSQ